VYEGDNTAMLYKETVDLDSRMDADDAIIDDSSVVVSRSPCSLELVLCSYIHLPPTSSSLC
jgi:hypothetical protein